MQLERGGGIALWRQIQTELEQELDQGRYAAGSRLPTEKELSGRFGVNRHTVRRALAGLEEDGRIVVEQGRGAFVRGPVVSYTLARRVRFSQNILRQMRSPKGRLLESGVAPAGQEAAAALHIAKGDRISRLVILGEADGVPVLLGVSSFPHARYPNLIQAYKATGSITAALRQAGLGDYVRLRTTITARMPTAREAGLLDQPRARPVLVAESLNVTPQGEPVEWCVSCWAAERVQFAVEPDHAPAPR